MELSDYKKLRFTDLKTKLDFKQLEVENGGNVQPLSIGSIPNEERYGASPRAFIRCT